MDEDKKWMNIHGPLKTMVHVAMSGIISSASYVMRYNNLNIVENKQDLKSNELKRAWACWDMAFESWEKELNLKGYRTRETYKLLERFRNIAFTIIDNDGPYLKLVYWFISSWEEVKKSDEVLK